jgi:hypothetical protein
MDGVGGFRVVGEGMVGGSTVVGSGFGRCQHGVEGWLVVFYD